MVSILVGGRPDTHPVIRRSIPGEGPSPRAWARLVGHPSARSASQMRRELRRMIGYTVVDAMSLQEMRDGQDGRKYAVLANGTVFGSRG